MGPVPGNTADVLCVVSGWFTLLLCRFFLNPKGKGYLCSSLENLEACLPQGQNGQSGTRSPPNQTKGKVTGNHVQQHPAEGATVLCKPYSNPLLSKLCRNAVSLGVGGSYQKKTRIDQTESSRSPDSCAAVHHNGAVLRVKWARLSHFEQEIEEWSRWLWDTKVRPRSIMKVQNLSRFLCL